MNWKALLKRLQYIFLGGLLVISGLGVYSYTTPDTDEFEISKNLEIFSSLYRELNLYYVDEVQPGDLMKEGIDAMLKSLDPYTNYIPESKMEDYRFMTTGQYGGIGASIRKKGDHVVIAEPYKGFPAQEAGLMAGDKIIEVKGRSVKGKSTSEISDILKGQAGTKIKVTVERPGREKPISFEFEREKVKIPSVPFYGMVNDTVGYIKLTNFTRSASEEVISGFKDLKRTEGMDQVILDLRGNGGGLLKEAVKIVNIFVEQGQEVVSTKGRVSEWNREHRALNKPLDTNIRVVVMVDGKSASASEIVSGALQDLDRGVVVGRNTFGKGLVQQTRPLEYNSKLKLTVAKYYIPSGRCIQEVDYSKEGKNGHGKNIPDSLIKTYRTRNGRKVLDARGINPDLRVDKRTYHELTQTLLNRQVVFDYATQYRLDHDSIAGPMEFTLSDEAYADFKERVAELEAFDYKTDTEDLLAKLRETARDEKYFGHAKEEYESLKKQLTPNTQADLDRFKEEIREVIEQEVASRYYYRSGRIQASLENDRALDTALKVLRPSKYEGILSGPGNVKAKKGRE